MIHVAWRRLVSQKIICIRYCCGFPFKCVTLTLLGTPGTFLSQHTHILVPSSPTEKGSYSFSIQVHKSGVFLSRLYFQQPLKKLSKDPVPGVTLCELPNQQLISMWAKWEYQLSIKGNQKETRGRLPSFPNMSSAKLEKSTWDRYVTGLRQTYKVNWFFTPESITSVATTIPSKSKLLSTFFSQTFYQTIIQRWSNKLIP